MRIFAFLIFSLTFSLSNGQESIIYSSDGRLKVDTTLIITNEALLALPKIENNLLPLLHNRIEYPIISIENNLQGLEIVKITVNQKDNRLKIELIKGIDPWIDDAVKKAFYSLKYTILSELTGFDELVFYIPFQFGIEKEEFERNLKMNSAVTIKATLEPLKTVTIK